MYVGWASQQRSILGNRSQIWWRTSQTLSNNIWPSTRTKQCVPGSCALTSPNSEDTAAHGRHTAQQLQRQPLPGARGGILSGKADGAAHSGIKNIVFATIAPHSGATAAMASGIRPTYSGNSAGQQPRLTYTPDAESRHSGWTKARRSIVNVSWVFNFFLFHHLALQVHRLPDPQG